jgi:hypothetical protein
MREKAVVIRDREAKAKALADTARLGLAQGMTVTDRPPPEIRGNRRQISFVVLLHT